MSQMVHLRIPQNLYENVKKIAERLGFKSVQEFIREAVRKQSFEYEKKLALLQLRKDFGSLKGEVERLSHEERSQLLKELMKEGSSELLRKHGLNEV